MKTSALARYIDHTLLKPEARPQDIEKICSEAALHNFFAVCINPLFVDRAARLLSDSKIGLATVIGFPLGSNTTNVKVKETVDAIESGATEIDMVMQIGMLKGGYLSEVEKDIHSVVKAAGSYIVKVIIETGLLADDEIKKASLISVDAGAAFVKTSTGFGPRGATVNDIKLIKSVVGERSQVKASGGIKTRDQAIAMIDAGATRIGTSCGVAIVKEGDR